MDKERISDLINRYFAAEATEKEEEELFQLFTNEDVAGAFPDDSVFFRRMKEAVEVPEPSVDFEKRLLASLPGERDEKRGVVRRMLTYAASAAAVLIAATMVFQIIFNDRDRLTDTFDDPQMAYAETMKTLRLVADNLNQGLNSGKGSINDMKILTSIPGDRFSTLKEIEAYSKDKLKPFNYLSNPTSIFNLDKSENSR